MAGTRHFYLLCVDTGSEDHKPPVWWVLGCVHQRDVVWADHSLPCSAKIKNERNYTRVGTLIVATLL